ncbi:MAG: peptide chain release factor 1, partial [Propionibacterium acidifaciens]
MFEAAQSLREEFVRLETQLADPAVIGDPRRSRRIGRRYSELSGIVRALDEHDRLADDLAA